MSDKLRLRNKLETLLRNKNTKVVSFVNTFFHFRRGIPQNFPVENNWKLIDDVLGDEGCILL